MTTNHPEKLDSALIRPGRVDLQVAFGNATKSQIQELFERMYTSDAPRIRRGQIGAVAPAPTKSMASTLTPPATPTTTQDPSSGLSAAQTMVKAEFGLPERSLAECAQEFASHIPDTLFSPAEIQGFLLKRKKNPQKACAEIARWVEGMVEGKERKTKVLDVQ